MSNPLSAYCRWLAGQRKAPLAVVVGAAVPPAEDAVRAATNFALRTPAARRAAVQSVFQGRVPAFVAAQVAAIQSRPFEAVRRWVLDAQEGPFTHRPELAAALARSRMAEALVGPDVLEALVARAHALWQVDVLASLGRPSAGLLTVAVFSGPDESIPDRAAAVRRLLADGCRVGHEPVVIAALLHDPVRYTEIGRVLLGVLIAEREAAGLQPDEPPSRRQPRSTLLEIAVDIRAYDLAAALVARGADPWRRTMREANPATCTLLGYALAHAPEEDRAALLALGGEGAAAWMRDHGTSAAVTAPENHRRPAFRA